MLPCYAFLTETTKTKQIHDNTKPIQQFLVK